MSSENQGNAPSSLPERPDPIPAGVRALMDLFERSLTQIQFPDVSSEHLKALVEEVDECDAEVNRLFNALEEAQTKLTEKRAQLLKMSDRGLAYARVFAGDNEALLLELDAINLVQSTGRKQSKKPKGRGRPKASASASTTEENVPSSPPTSDKSDEEEVKAKSNEPETTNSVDEVVEGENSVDEAVVVVLEDQDDFEDDQQESANKTSNRPRKRKIPRSRSSMS